MFPHAKNPHPGLCTVALGLIAIVCGGCMTFVKEDHYFQSLNDKDEPTNYFRLKVRGSAFFSSARYVSGYYDERAVDLFFNEVKTASGQSNGELFRSDLKDGEDTIRPLTPGADDGAFVMVLSSNASSVTDAIGQFAQNQQVADAITNIANRQTILGSPDAQSSYRRDQAVSLTSEVGGLMSLVPDSGDQATTTSALLRVLNAIARSEGHAEPFSDLKQAASWIRVQRSSLSKGDSR